jgi:hypothetical protein
MKCLNCGKPIRKATKHVYVKREPSQYDRRDLSMISYVYVGDTLPRAADDLVKLTNQKVVAVSYAEHGANAGSIDSFHTWDGMSYQPIFGYFCTNRCASRFGKRCAEQGFRP